MDYQPEGLARSPRISESSTNFILRPQLSDSAFGNRTESTLPLSNSVENHELQIHFGQLGVSAVPNKPPSFFKLLPWLLWAILSESYVLYFLISIVLQLYRQCEFGEYQLSSVQMGFLLFLIVLDLACRCFTYRQFTLRDLPNPYQQYQVWSRANGWTLVPYSDLKAGQVVCLRRYADSKHVNPVSMLPICVASRSSFLSSKTLWLDNQPEIRKIHILPVIHSLLNSYLDQQIIEKQQIGSDGKQFNSKAFIQESEEVQKNITSESIPISSHKLAKIQFMVEYFFRSDSNDSFEASLNYENISCKFSKEDVLPSEVSLINQKWVIGVALASSNNFTQRRALQVLKSQNLLDKQLSIFFWYTGLVIFCLEWISFLAYLSLSNFLSSNYATQSYFTCLAVSFAAHHMNILCIAIMVFLQLSRLISRHRLKKEKKIRLKSYLHSLDKFAHVDTFIINQDSIQTLPDQFNFVFNTSTLLYDERALVFQLLSESRIVKQELYRHIVPLSKWFHFNEEISLKTRGRLLKEMRVSESCVELSIRIRKEAARQNYKLRLHQRPVFSSLNYIQDQGIKSKFEEMMLKNSKSNALISTNLRLRSKNHFLSIEIFDNKTNHWIPFCVADFEIEKDDTYFQKRRMGLGEHYLTVVLTERSWKYLKDTVNANDWERVMLLEEKEESEMKDILRSQIYEIEKKPNSRKIFYLSADTIPYLSQEYMRASLIRLSERCKHIIFHYISQYEKELCAAHLFRIFPNHIYLSNFCVDVTIFRMSTLSACIEQCSATRYALAVLNTKKTVKELMNHANVSLKTTTYILHTMVFKNGLLSFSTMLLFYLVFQGNSLDLDLYYAPSIHFLFNLLSCLPLIYTHCCPAEQSQSACMDDIREMKVMNLLKVLAYSFVSSVLLTSFLFSVINTSFFGNIFFALLVDTLIFANLYHIYKDSSKNKLFMILIVAFQIALSCVAVFLDCYYNSGNAFFILTDTQLIGEGYWLCVSTFVVCPFLIFVGMYVMDLAFADVKNGKNNQSDAGTQIVASVLKSQGKQMRFRQT